MPIGMNKCQSLLRKSVGKPIIKISLNDPSGTKRYLRANFEMLETKTFDQQYSCFVIIFRSTTNIQKTLSKF